MRVTFPMRRSLRLTPALLAASLIAAGATSSPFARAQTAGVSDERVTLPDGPGSLAGVGENVSIEGNMGGMSLQVPIEVPPGFDGVTPTLKLSYSSSAGSSLLGIGWSMAAPTIDRMTVYGLPKYDATDTFAADDSDELVKVASSGSTSTYRARVEGGFAKYTWNQDTLGEGGWWKVEFPDGRVAFYGADATGTLVAAARTTGNTASKTYKYHIVSMTDRFGHEMRYSYTKSPGGSVLLDRIEYAYEGTTPRFSVRFGYEARTDLLSDAKSGALIQLDQRLNSIKVFSGSEQIRRYAMTYESDATSGGFSRIATINQFGRLDVAYPIKWSFGYSKSLGGACTTGCEKPFMVDMGTVAGAVDIGNGKAQLVDINGDALPDLVRSSDTGKHTFYLAKLNSEGKSSFEPAGIDSSQTALGTSFILGQPNVQLLDVNGDGFTDLVDAKNKAVLCNYGLGDWSSKKDCFGTDSTVSVALADDASEPTQADPLGIRFFDWDGDKRIDWLRTLGGGAGTQVLPNLGGSSFGAPIDIDNIGKTFDEGSLQLADMNGDNLQDPVEITAGTVSYRLNLGRGKWTGWTPISVTGFSTSDYANIQLQDLNGDGLADLVVVVGDQIKYAINRNGAKFDDVVTLTNASGVVSGSIPSAGSGTIVAFADMNGNGSDDIVWMAPSGNIKFLELFPVRPNLLSRIENGIGMVQTVKYGTSLAEAARDAASSATTWKYKLPNSMLVVTEADTWVTLTGSDTGGVHEKLVYRYRDGFYDGAEKKFRGYVRVDRESLADQMTDGQDPGLSVSEYDVGTTSPFKAGLLINQKDYSGQGAALSLLRESRTTYSDDLAVCKVADIPTTGLPKAIKYACKTSEQSIVKEGKADAEAVTTQIDYAYDGYGNVAKVSNLGVVFRGTPEAKSACGACAGAGSFGNPCGPTCSGDESYDENTYVVPGTATGGAWIANRVAREVKYGVAGGPQTETLFFYDGPDFVGGAAGTLTKGALVRKSVRAGTGATDFIDEERNKIGADGRVIETIKPNGAVADATSYRTIFEYDSTGLDLLAKRMLNRDATGAYELRREFTYDTSFHAIIEATELMLMVGGKAVSARNATKYRIDDFARIAKVIEPGETDATAGSEYTFNFASPASEVKHLTRVGPGGGNDLEQRTCYDGRGRVFQNRSLIAPGQYQVSGFKVFNKRGSPVRIYEPYTATTGACDLAPPASVKFTSFSYDALGREIGVTFPDGTKTRVEYSPLTVTRYSEDDLDAASEGFGTPEVERFDGLGRLVAVERRLAKDGAAPTYSLEYDSLGRVISVKDPMGRLHTQEFDLLDRVTKVTDPNSGTTTMAYDADDSVVRRVDGAGNAISYEYDGFSRLVATFDEKDRAATQTIRKYDRIDGCTGCTNVAGRLAEVSFPLGADAVGTKVGFKRLGYDEKAKPTYEATSLEGKLFETTKVYDNAERLIGLTRADGTKAAFAYDGASRVISVNGLITSAKYDDQGDLTSVDMLGGIKTTYAYDARRRVAGHSIERGADKLYAVTYARSTFGSITAVIDASTARPGKIDRTTTYKHDAWHRLTEATLPGIGGGAAETLSVTYNLADDILSQSSSLGAASAAHLGEYTYGAQPGAVTKAGALSMTYDAAGRMTKRGALELKRDFRGRVVKVVTNDPAVTNASGSVYGDGPERVMAYEDGGVTYYLDGDLEVVDGVSYAYTSLGDKRVARAVNDVLAPKVLTDVAPADEAGGTFTAKPDGHITVADAWVSARVAAGAKLADGSTPSPLPRLLRASARRMLAEAGPALVLLHEDIRESIVMATDASGNVVAEQSYLPFGAVRESTGWVDLRGFGNQEIDASGLSRYKWRGLDTYTGRWDETDPLFLMLNASNVLEFGEATAQYAFVSNDPIDTTDPTGLAGEKRIPSANMKGKGNAQKVNSVMGVSGNKTKGEVNKLSKAEARKERKAERKAERAAAKKLANTRTTFAKKGQNKMSRFERGSLGASVISSLTAIGLAIAAAVYAGDSDKSNDTQGQQIGYAATAVGSFGTLGQAAASQQQLKRDQSPNKEKPKK